MGSCENVMREEKRLNRFTTRLSVEEHRGGKVGQKLELCWRRTQNSNMRQREEKSEAREQARENGNGLKD